MQNRKDGIALVLVLGFLAVLTILAVGFAISMRTERVASNTYVEMQRGTLLLDSVLARCIDDIDTEVGSDIYPVFTEFDDLMESPGGTGISVPSSAWKGIMTSDVPAFLLNDYLSLADAVPPITWTPINTDIAGINTEIGRYAYIILNCSSMLDANYIGGGKRSFGTNAAEISLDFSGITIATNFTDDRKNDGRYVSMPDLKVNNGVANLNSTLFPFSYYPQLKRESTPGKYKPLQPIDLSDMELVDVTNRSAIIEAFDNSGIVVSNGSLSDLFDNLVDYVDADSVPKNLDSFCTEAVPMINELVYSNYTLTVTDSLGPPLVTRYENYLVLNIETWFPFGNTAASSYELDATVTAPAGYVLNKGLAGDVLSTGKNSFDVKQLVYANTNAGVANPSPVLIIDSIRVREAGAGAGGGTTVDQTTFSPSKSWTSEGATYCVDPRLNWDGNVTEQWKDSTVALSTISTTTGMNPGLSAVNEGPSLMYVRNATIMNPAELGYLNIGAPWATVCLYQPNRHSVLDQFTTESFMTNRYGLININGKVPEIIQAGVKDALYSAYGPAELGTNEVKFATGSAWAAGIMSSSSKTNVSVSIIGVDMATLPGTTDAERESAIGNVYRLYSYRQQLFVVVILIQSTKGGNVMSESSAVACVWRDPLPDTFNEHPAFVRWVKILDE